MHELASRWVGSDLRLTGWPEHKDRPPELETVVLVVGVGRRGGERLAQCTEGVEERGHDLQTARSRGTQIISLMHAPDPEGGMGGMGSVGMKLKYHFALLLSA